METDNEVGNVELSTITPRTMALHEISSDDEVKNEHVIDEFATLEHTMEYLDEDSDDKFNIIEPSTSEMLSLTSTINSAALKVCLTQQLPCKSDIFVCGLCPKRFTYPHPIQKHMLMRHMSAKPCYKCSCDTTASYDTIDELVLHKVQYADKDTHLKCNLCGIFFTTIKDLTHHKELKTFLCTKCRTNFDKCSLLHDHWRHLNTVGHFKCETCNFQTASCAIIKNHGSSRRCRPMTKDDVVNRWHQPTNPSHTRPEHTCDICQKVYRKPYQLQKHRKLHDSIFMYKCEYCNVMFESDSVWRQHKCAEMKEVEEVEKNSGTKTKMETMYQCTFCKNTFLKPTHLKDHMSASHYITIDNQMDMLSCLKRINVLSMTHVPKPRPRNTSNTVKKTRSVRKSKNVDKTPENDVGECDVAIKAELTLDEELEQETRNATDSLALLESLMNNPSETVSCVMKTEDLHFDMDNEDFEDDIIILDTDKAIQYKKEEPQTPERSETLQSIDEYLEKHERLHTFSILVERVSQVEMPVVKQEAVNSPVQNGDSSVAIKQLLKVRNIFKRKIGKKTFQCTNVSCNKVFTVKNDMKQHMMNMECKQLSELPHYQCLRCGVQTDDVLLYMKHWENHGFAEEQCPSCLLDMKGYLSSHVEEHIREGFYGKRVRCRECKVAIMAHSKLMHWESHLLYNERRGNKAEGLKPITSIPKVCSACSKPFQRVSELKRHLVEHIVRDALRRKRRNESLKCDICEDGVPFETINAFKQHWREHADLRLYKCKICTKMFADSSNFTKHKKVHDLNCLQCDTCGRKFASKRMLILHMEYHEMNKPLKCAECDKVFHFRSVLARHYKTSHGIRKYGFKCVYCFEGFTAWLDLRNHLWVEHGVRKSNADCQLCGLQCRTFMQLRTHRKLKHNVNSQKTNNSPVSKKRELK